MAPRQHSPVNFSRAALGAVAAAFLILGCAPDPIEPTRPGSGGSTNPATGGAPGSSGGAPGSGGASSSGGALGSGGANSGGASSGGATGSGGRGSGGATASGGSTGSGGRGTGGAATGTGGAATGTGGRGTGGGASGTGGMSGGAGATGTFAAAAAIFGTSCGTGMCHQGGAHVDLRNTAGLRDRIVSKMISGTMSMASCQTKTYIVPNNPAMSVISQIIKAAVTGCGARMPDDCSTSSATPRRCLTTEQIATIDAWIMAGAPP